MTEKKRPLVKRRILRLFTWLAGIALVLYLFGHQTQLVIVTHYIAKRAPDVNVVPQPLTDQSVSQAPGTTLSYYGMAFQVPWQGIVKQRVAKNITALNFASGQAIMIWAPTGKDGFLNQAARDSTTGSPSVRATLQGDLTTPPYQQYSSLLNITPSQIRPFTSPRTAGRGFLLLFFKAIAVNLHSGAYEFHTPALRGFQQGDPATSSRVQLDMFDNPGNSLGEVICFLGKDASARGTQADINRIIQTFHPLVASADSAANLRAATPSSR